MAPPAGDSPRLGQEIHSPTLPAQNLTVSSAEPSSPLTWPPELIVRRAGEDCLERPRSLHCTSLIEVAQKRMSMKEREATERRKERLWNSGCVDWKPWLASPSKS